jgi:hypothetical protein
MQMDATGSIDTSEVGSIFRVDILTVAVFEMLEASYSSILASQILYF